VFLKTPGLCTSRQKLQVHAWWFTLVISAAREAEVEGLWSEALPGKSKRPYLKNSLKQKRLETGLK
jgi:hypothetical protein